VFRRFFNFLQRHFDPQPSIDSLNAELHMRYFPGSPSNREKKKTKRRAKHTHRPAGQGRRSRWYLPSLISIVQRRRSRPSCRFAYSRADRQASRDARFRAIARNDRIENALQEHRKGGRPAA
jgi:hypothetical protein